MKSDGLNLRCMLDFHWLTSQSVSGTSKVKSCNSPGSVSPDPLCTPQDLLHPPHILLRIHTHRVKRRFGHVDRDPIVEKAQLFQPFRTLDERLRPAHKPFQSIFPIAIESEVLVVRRLHSVSIKGNRCPGKIKCPAH